jgi:hypothetical protein
MRDARAARGWRSVPDLQQPRTAIDYILAQLDENMPFHMHDLNLRFTRIDTKAGLERRLMR